MRTPEEQLFWDIFGNGDEQRDREEERYNQELLKDETDETDD